MKYFFSVSLVLAVVLFSSATTFGQLVLQETFVTATTNIATLPGWADIPVGSSQIGSTQGPPNIQVPDSLALLYSGYFESGVGHYARLTGGGQDAQATTASITAPTSGTSSVYLAFMIKVDSASAAGDYCLIVRNTSNHNRWRMWLRNSNGGANFQFGIGQGSTTQQYAANNYDFGTTYLVVMKYDFNTTATNDARLYLWVNPASSSFGKTEDPSPVIGPYNDGVTNDFALINRLALVQNGIGTAPTFSIGGIRMGTSWAAVLPASPVYYSGTGAVDDPNNWGTNPDGSGTHPSDFTADGQFFLVRNTTAVTLTNVWSVTGTGSRVVVGNGVNFTVGSGGILSVPLGSVDVSNGGTLTLTQGFFWPIFGDIAGTVALDNPAGITLDADYTFPPGAGYFDLTSGDLDVSTFTLKVKGRIRTLGHRIYGAGSFILDSAASIHIYSPNGIMLSGSTGDIQTTTRTYSRYASYNYRGTSNQVTGDAIPDTVANFTLQMGSRDSIVTLSKRVATTGNLTLNLGRLKLGNYDFHFSNPVGYSDSGYVITNGTGSLIRPVTSSTRSKKSMPIGSATEYRFAAVTFVDSLGIATNLAFRYVSGDAGSAGLPTGITRYYTGGYWTISSAPVQPGKAFRLDLRVDGIPLDTTTMRILRRPDAPTAWAFASTGSADTNGVLTDQGVASLGQFSVGDQTSTTSTLNVALASGWNLISNPVTNPVPGDSVRQLFPTSLNAYAFEYAGGYVQRYQMANGKGYWGKFPAAISNAVTGTPRTRDSIAVVAGWNIVGSISNTVDTNTIVSVPLGLRASAWFGYLGGYAAVTQLVPGKGYWVKSNGTGKFVLANPLGKVRATAAAKSLDDMLNTLTITDSKGGSQTLYFGANGQGQIAEAMYTMPPLPPAGGFDARFETSEGGSMVRMHEVTASGEFPVAIQSEAYPLTVSWNVSKGTASYELTDGRGDEGFPSKEMKGEGTVQITKSDLNKIIVRLTGGEALPTEYALSQNYPNPFNPSTTIKYDLPKDSRVSLTLYNLLGQEVGTLVNEEQKAGYKSVQWNASNYASGVYFYRLQAGNFVASKKLLLVK